MNIDYDKSHKFYNEGREAMRKNDYLKAIELFERSSKLAPHFKTFELLGECLLSINKPLEAIIALATSAGLGSKPFRATYLLGKALSQTGQESDAIDQLQKAIKLKPDYKAAKELLNKLKSHDN